jgi:hypothetical protein
MNILFPQFAPLANSPKRNFNVLALLCFIMTLLTLEVSIACSYRGLAPYWLLSWFMISLMHFFKQTLVHLLSIRFERFKPRFRRKIPHVWISEWIRRLTTAKEDDNKVLYGYCLNHLNSAPVQFNHSCYCILSKLQSTDCGTDKIEYLTRNLDRLLSDRPSSAIVIAGDFNKLNLTVYVTVST